MKLDNKWNSGKWNNFFLVPLNLTWNILKLKQTWKWNTDNPKDCVPEKNFIVAFCFLWRSTESCKQHYSQLKLTLKLYQREKLFHFLKQNFLQVSTSFHLLLLEEFILVAFKRSTRVWIKRGMRVNASELKWQLSCGDVFTGVLGMWDVGYRNKEARSHNLIVPAFFHNNYHGDCNFRSARIRLSQFVTSHPRQSYPKRHDTRFSVRLKKIG